SHREAYNRAPQQDMFESRERAPDRPAPTAPPSQPPKYPDAARDSKSPPRPSSSPATDSPPPDGPPPALGSPCPSPPPRPAPPRPNMTTCSRGNTLPMNVEQPSGRHDRAPWEAPTSFPEDPAEAYLTRSGSRASYTDYLNHRALSTLRQRTS